MVRLSHQDLIGACLRRSPNWMTWTPYAAQAVNPASPLTRKRVCLSAPASFIPVKNEVMDLEDGVSMVRRVPGVTVSMGTDSVPDYALPVLRGRCRFLVGVTRLRRKPPMSSRGTLLSQSARVAIELFGDLSTTDENI